jgi:hypothetical protein
MQPDSRGLGKAAPSFAAEAQGSMISFVFEKAGNLWAEPLDL